MDFFKKAAMGYLPLIKMLSLLMFSLVLIVGISVLISYPLWWLALHKTKFFTTGALIVLGAIIGWVLLIRPLLRRKESAIQGIKKAGSKLLGLLLPLGLLLGGYGIALLIKTGPLVLGLILLLLYLLLVGYLLYNVHNRQ